MSVRDRLRARSLPTQRVAFYADHDAWDEAQQELQEAAAALLDVQRRGAPDADAQARHDAATAAQDALETVEFTIHAIPPAQWEALVALYPAKDGATHGWDFDPDAFWTPMLAATVTIDGQPWTEADQAEDAAALTIGERNTLINTAVALNTRTIGATVEDSAQTSS